MSPYIKAMRLSRWPRSLAIFAGTAAFFFLHRSAYSFYSPARLILYASVAFLLTWGISTANYIINEIVDAPYDVHHPTKKNRPLVRGEVDQTAFLFIGLALISSCLAAALIFFTVSFFLSLLGLLAAGFIYNVKPIRTKDIPFLDAISESANNPIRFFIGWYAFAASSTFPPLSLLVSWWAFGNFLMVAKRLSEFRVLKEKAGDYRTSHKRYTRTSLMLGMVTSAVIFFVAYVTFAWSFHLPYLLYLSPFVFFFLVLIFRKTLSERSVMEEPERLLGDLPFALYTALLLVVFSLAFLLEKPSP